MKIWDFFHECEKFDPFFSRVERSRMSGKNVEFITRVEVIPDHQ